MTETPKPCDVMWLDVGNLEALAAAETRPEVVTWLRDLAQRMRTALQAPTASSCVAAGAEDTRRLDWLNKAVPSGAFRLGVERYVREASEEIVRRGFDVRDGIDAAMQYAARQGARL